MWTGSYVKKNDASVRGRKVYLTLVGLTDRSSWEKVNTIQAHGRLQMYIMAKWVSNAC